jgi:hypothetical protein
MDDLVGFLILDRKTDNARNALRDVADGLEQPRLLALPHALVERIARAFVQSALFEPLAFGHLNDCIALIVREEIGQLYRPVVFVNSVQKMQKQIDEQGT